MDQNSCRQIDAWSRFLRCSVVLPAMPGLIILNAVYRRRSVHGVLKACLRIVMSKQGPSNS